MTQKVGWLVDLAGLQFAEDEGPKWIQAMPINKYKHPVYGTIDFNLDRVTRFCSNIKAKVRGQDLDIDYDHKKRQDIAAGWIQDAEVRTGNPDPKLNGLWILVEFTPKAKEQIRAKEYRYFSPEFLDEWTNPINGVTYKDVMTGGGITNRPFLKDIVPLNLSEILSASDQQEGGRTVDPEQLKEVAKLLGLPDDATGDQILGALQVKLGVPGNEDPADPADPDSGTQGGESAPSGASLSEDIKKLAETNPGIKALMDVVEAQAAQLQNQSKELAENTKQLKEARVESAVKALSEKAKGKGFAIPPVTKNALSEVLMDAPKQFSDKVIQAFDSLLDKGLVELGERGGQRQDGKQDDDEQAFVREVKKLQESETGLSFGEASIRVAQEQPDLFAAYQSASYGNDK